MKKNTTIGLVLVIAVVTVVALVIMATAPRWGVGATSGDDCMEFRNRCEYPVHVVVAKEVSFYDQRDGSGGEGTVTLLEFNLDGYGHGGTGWKTVANMDVSEWERLWVTVWEMDDRSNKATVQVPYGFGGYRDLAEVTVGGTHDISAMVTVR